MFRVVLAISLCLAFLHLWVRRKLNLCAYQVSIPFFLAKADSARGKQSVFIFFLSPFILCFSGFSVCIFSPGFGSTKLLNSSRFRVQCHPKSLGLTGRSVVTEIWPQKLSPKPSVNQTSTRGMAGGSRSTSGRQGSLTSPWRVSAPCWAQNKFLRCPWQPKPDQVALGRNYKRFFALNQFFIAIFTIFESEKQLVFSRCSTKGHTNFSDSIVG